MKRSNGKDETGAQVAPLDLSEAEAAKMHLAEVASLLADGQRKQAAARARLHAERAGKTELAELVRLLAGGLDAAGNQYGKRGRPPRVGWDDTDEGLRNFILKSKIATAARRLAAAWTAAQLVHGSKRVPAAELADYAVRVCWLSMGGGTLDENVAILAQAIEAEPKEAAEYLLPYAKETLRSIGLLTTPFKGFRGHALRKIAERYGVSESKIKRAH